MRFTLSLFFLFSTIGVAADWQDHLASNVLSAHFLSEEDRAFCSEKISSYRLHALHVKSLYGAKGSGEYRHDVADLLRQKVFSQIKVLEDPKFLFASPVSSGYGDFFQMLEEIACVKSHWPAADVRAVVYTRSGDVLPKCDYAPFGLTQTDVTVTSDKGRLDELLEFANSSNLSLIAPIGWDEIRKILGDNLEGKRLLSFSNYSEDSPFKDHPNHYTTGLFPLEEGILFPQVSLHEFDNPILSEIAGRGDSLYFAYFEGENLERFLDLIAHLEADRAIVIANRQKEEVLVRNGVQIQIIDPFPLSYHDFCKLIHIAKEPIGCTGDLPFSQVLSQGKLPFYEAIEGKNRFMEGLFLTTKYHLGNHPLTKYIDQLRLKERETQKMAALIQTGLLQEAWIRLRDTLSESFDLRQHLLGRLNRHLLAEKCPQLAVQEESLSDRFIRGELSAEVFYTLLLEYVSDETRKCR